MFIHVQSIRLLCEIVGSHEATRFGFFVVGVADKR